MAAAPASGAARRGRLQGSRRCPGEEVPPGLVRGSLPGSVARLVAACEIRTVRRIIAHGVHHVSTRMPHRAGPQAPKKSVHSRLRFALSMRAAVRHGWNWTRPIMGMASGAPCRIQRERFYSRPASSSGRTGLRQNPSCLSDACAESLAGACNLSTAFPHLVAGATMNHNSLTRRHGSVIVKDLGARPPQASEKTISAGQGGGGCRQ